MAEFPSFRSPVWIGRSQKRWVLGWMYPALLWLVMVVVAFLAFNQQTLNYFEEGGAVIKRMVVLPGNHSSVPARP